VIVIGESVQRMRNSVLPQEIHVNLMDQLTTIDSNVHYHIIPSRGEWNCGREWKVL
jgi:hypothetical protein